METNFDARPAILFALSSNDRRTRAIYACMLEVTGRSTLPKRLGIVGVPVKAMKGDAAALMMVFTMDFQRDLSGWSGFGVKQVMISAAPDACPACAARPGQLFSI